MSLLTVKNFSIRRNLEIMNLEQALKLPQGEIKEAKLKKIRDLFDPENIAIALYVLKENNDCKNINSQADIIEKANQYGFLRATVPCQRQSKKQTNYYESETPFIFSDDFFLFFSAILFLCSAILLVLNVYGGCSNSGLANTIKTYLDVTECKF